MTNEDYEYFVLWTYSITRSIWYTVGDSLHQPVKFDEKDLRFRKYAQWPATDQPAYFLPTGINPNHTPNFKEMALQLRLAFLEEIKREANVKQIKEESNQRIPLKEWIKSLPEGNHSVPKFYSLVELKISARLYKNIEYFDNYSKISIKSLDE